MSPYHRLRMGLALRPAMSEHNQLVVVVVVLFFFSLYTSYDNDKMRH